jgi:hypothetical protein
MANQWVVDIIPTTTYEYCQGGYTGFQSNDIGKKDREQYANCCAGQAEPKVTSSIKEFRGACQFWRVGLTHRITFDKLRIKFKIYGLKPNKSAWVSMRSNRSRYTGP